MASERRIAGVALITVAVVYALLGATIVFIALNGGEDFRLLPLSPDFLMGLMTPGLAGLILWSHPRNGVGWVLLAAGAASVVFGFSNQIGMYAMQQWDATGFLTLCAWLVQWTWYPSFALTLTFLPLLFPDGHVPSAAWRPVAWAAAAVVATRTFLLATFPGPLLEGIVPIANPVGLSITPTVDAWMQRILVLGWPLLVVLCLSAVIVRYRRADAERRAQLRWWIAAAVIGMGYYFLTEHGVLLALLVPPATAVAILRYRLYDIDRVLVRAVVFTGLAGIVVIFYAAAVGVITAVAGRTVEPSVTLSVVVTVLAALAFFPVRERLERLARRLVYGQRAAPYEILTALAAQISRTLSVEEVVPELTARVGHALQASGVSIRVDIADGLVRETAWPDHAAVADRPVASRTITNAGIRVGEIAVHRGESRLTQFEERLLDDLAAHAGPALQNVVLHEQLQDRLRALLVQAAELRASRERLYAAETTARRGLERDIHDGAQQQLVALAVQLGNAADASEAHDRETSARLRAFQKATEATLDNLRNLTRGLHPPLLTDLGVGAALRAYVASTDAPVRVRAHVRRLPPHVETTAYFCILEAIQNATKHARATGITVEVHETDDVVRFSIEDDGCGFEPDQVTFGAGIQNIRDRLGAVGGDMTITSAPGGGTRLEGRIPVARDLIPSPAPARNGYLTSAS